MKKLLGLLSISTLTASLPAPLLANTPLTRVKRDVSTLTSNSNNDDYLPLKKISGISGVLSIAVDKTDNVYFGTKNGAFVLKQGETTPTKIDGIEGLIYSIVSDKLDNIYFGGDEGIFVLKQGSTTPTKIDVVTNRINSIAIDKLDNVYFGTKNGAFVLKQGETTPTKIDGIEGLIYSIVSDKLDNIYFGGDEGIFVLKQGSTTPTKIDVVTNRINSIAIDKLDNVYFGTKNGAFVLKQGETTPTKIDGINSLIYFIVSDNKHYLYFGTNHGAYVIHSALTSLEWTKQQSQFNLVDSSSKTKTWTRPDLITADGELNIEITNPNIDKVIFDNVQQSQTNKQWNINVKPETSERDHNLQVMFTLDGKQYTSEIMVSMQAKIVPPTPSIKENLDKVIKFADENNLGNIGDNNNETIIAAITQKNSLQVDFSQIEFEKKDIHSATLTTKPDSKSYQGSVVVKYNVVPTTIVDLKIDLQPTAPTTQVVKDYVGKIDPSTITNPVNTFSYAKKQWK